MNDKLQTTPSTSADSALTRKRTIGLPALHKRIATPQVVATPDVMANRIALLLDYSGSMAGREASSKINLLKDAMQGFITACNFADTSLAIETFPSGDHDESEIGAKSARVPLTTLQPFLLTSVMMLTAGGGTPMAQAMRYAIENYSLTRAVLVSDGDADNPSGAIEQARTYREAQVPVDTIHIGDSVGGEETLKEIASRTGGLFIKFKNVNQFVKSFKFLTPAYYAQLTAGNAKEILNADEVV